MCIYGSRTNGPASQTSQYAFAPFDEQTGVLMSIVKRHLAEHEERMVLIEEICIDKGALVYDIDSDEVFFSADEEAYKNAYVTVFQAWAKGTIKGTAEQVFNATKSILED
jgi:hypothetical protein